MSLLDEIRNDPWIARSCYAADNVYAYRKDCGQSLHDVIKVYNFIPVYDKWCLYCNKKDVKLRCGGCRSVFFCSVECQRKCWPIHKHHCGRYLFNNCIKCGKPNPTLECDKCPVKYCDRICKEHIEKAHKEFDCKYLSETFTREFTG